MRLRLTIVGGTAVLLSSVGLYPLYESGTWFTTGLGAVLVVLAAGLLARRTRLAAALHPLVALLALFLYLTVLFAARQAFLDLVPTPASTARLGRLLSEGWHDANAYAAPVPMLPAIDVLTGAGIGLVAVLVDFLAVSLRRAALAGLPLLAVYSVPAAVRQQAVSSIAFLLGAGGYLTLLVVDGRERLAGWGRPVFTRRWTPGRDDDRPDSAPLAATGRRIGLTAMAISVVLPFAIPGIRPHGLFGIGGGSVSGSGDGSITGLNALDPLVSVRRQLVREGDAEVLRYRTTDGNAPDYLRMYSLDRFDGETWTMSSPLRAGGDARVSGKTLPIDSAMAGVPTRTVATDISINSDVHGLDVLPTPYPSTHVDIKGDWRVYEPSLTVFSSHDSAGGRSYKVTSLRAEPTYQELLSDAPLPGSIISRYLSVPNTISGDVTKLASDITKGTDTPYEKAVKLQNWFTRPGNFTYSVDAPPPRQSGALEDFLFTSKTGYCEQFASSMALLARILGIPARVGMGYTAGTRQPNGSWIVRTKDAHAWPELYFSGVGWLRFEPTPGGDGGQGTAIAPSYTSPQLLAGTPGSGTQLQTPSGGSLPNPQSTNGTRAALRHRPDLPADERAASGVVTEQHRSHLPVGWLVAGLVLLLLLLTPMVLRRWTRLRRWSRAKSDAAIAHAAWDELRADAADHGLRWPVSDTPRSTARRLASDLRLEPDGTVAEALERLSRAEERARYAPETAPAATLREDVRVLREAFRARARRHARIRAVLFPPSAMAALRRAGSRIADTFDRLDVAMPRRRRPATRTSGRA